MLTGASGFNGRVQRQQIGLVGNARHGMNDLADLFGLAFQLSDHLGGFEVGIGRVTDPFNQAFDVGRRGFGKRLQLIN